MEFLKHSRKMWLEAVIVLGVLARFLPRGGLFPWQFNLVYLLVFLGLLGLVHAVCRALKLPSPGPVSLASVGSFLLGVQLLLMAERQPHYQPVTTPGEPLDFAGLFGLPVFLPIAHLAVLHTLTRSPFAVLTAACLHLASPLNAVGFERASNGMLTFIVASLLTAAFALREGQFPRRSRWNVAPLLLMVLGFLLPVLLGRAPNPHLAQMEALKWLALAALAVVVSCRPQALEVAQQVVLVQGGLMLFAAGHRVLSLSASHGLAGALSGRLSFQLLHPNTVAAWWVLALPVLALPQVTGQWEKPWRRMRGVLIGGGVLSLLLTGSRAGLAALLLGWLGGAVLAAAPARLPWRRGLAAGAVLLCLGFGALAACSSESGSLLTERLRLRLHGESGTSDRVLYWRTAALTIRHNLLVGVGLLQPEALAPAAGTLPMRYLPALRTWLGWGPFGAHAHQALLVWALGGGVLAVFGVFWGLALLGVRLRRHHDLGERRLAAVAVSGAVLLGAVDYPYGFAAVSVLVLLGIAPLLSEPEVPVEPSEPSTPVLFPVMLVAAALVHRYPHIKVAEIKAHIEGYWWYMDEPYQPRIAQFFQEAVSWQPGNPDLLIKATRYWLKHQPGPEARWTHEAFREHLPHSPQWQRTLAYGEWMRDDFHSAKFHLQEAIRLDPVGAFTGGCEMDFALLSHLAGDPLAASEYAVQAILTDERTLNHLAWEPCRITLRDGRVVPTLAMIGDPCSPPDLKYLLSPPSSAIRNISLAYVKTARILNAEQRATALTLDDLLPEITETLARLSASDVADDQAAAALGLANMQRLMAMLGRQGEALSLLAASGNSVAQGALDLLEELGEERSLFYGGQAFLPDPGISGAAAVGSGDSSERTAADLTADASAQALMNQGNLAAARGDWEAARTAFTTLAERHPESEVPLVALATVAQGQGQPAEAERLLREVLRRNPTQLTASYNLGTLLLREGRYQEAAEALTQTVTLEPGHALAYYNLGLAFGELPGWETASQAALKRFLALTEQQPALETYREQARKRLDGQHR